MKFHTLVLFFALSLAVPATTYAVDSIVTNSTAQTQAASAQYQVGVEDILDINVFQPQTLNATLTVAPDGTVNFPYIGSIQVKGLTLVEIQQKFQTSLAEYMKYPVVAVSLKESRSRVFYVYGEVNHPDSYFIQENLSVVQAISMAGGFTHLAATNDVKILRKKKDGSGNITMSVKVADVMSGKSEDVKVEPGDIITVLQKWF